VLHQVAGSPAAAQALLDRVMIMEARNIDEQVQILCQELPRLLRPEEGNDIRMVVLDSVSALFRGEFGSGLDDSLDRSKAVFTVAKRMKSLSEQYGIPFLVTNQVRPALTHASVAGCPSSTGQIVREVDLSSKSACEH
jgi:RecA/RadA recombinase